jgi:hypothetical protein
MGQSRKHSFQRAVEHFLEKWVTVFRPVVRGFRAHEDMKKSRLGVQPGFSFVEK